MRDSSVTAERDEYVGASWNGSGKLNEVQPSAAEGFRDVYERIKAILAEARSTWYCAINTAMVTAYWEIGRTIVEEEQQGEHRAEYDQALVEELSVRLKADFGKGFDRSNLWHMRSFYLSYPILDALRRELSWTHYRLLLRVEKPEAAGVLRSGSRQFPLVNSRIRAADSLLAI